jgi:hypothetical protein
MQLITLLKTLFFSACNQLVAAFGNDFMSLMMKLNSSICEHVKSYDFPCI